ncbi:DExH-box ATP-dependent RNA helicase DExH14 isoform X2 [Curcuma longa]|uniref:DExH-box ATP-dependent RNA helicase DExH14 isoform X2 n=1 Tax=Curcuma longa TaxID=136217 RepID=UPI003D9F8080
MLVPLPRLTSSFRGPYDVDQAYLRRKSILRNLKSRRANDEPELARKLIPHWDEAELRQAYRQFVGSVVELVNGEVSSEEFREVAKTVYDLFGHFHMDNDLTKSVTQKKIELQRLIGYNIEDAILQKMASLVQRLYALQHTPNNALVAQEIGADGCGDSTIEFGSELSFQVPSRFVLDAPLENVTPLSSDFLPTSTFDDNHHSRTHFANHNSTTDQRTGSLKWLKDACDMIVQHDGASQISGDELAMALCRVLLSNKAGDEIAGDLLDLVGDGSFETVQDLLLHRKELVNAIQHGLFILKSEKISSNNQPKMPSYGTQVIVQTESERQMDRLRRKEEKRNKRLGEYGNTLDFPVESFYSLLLASQKKQPLDDFMGIGHGLNSVLISALPEGTIRLHHSGYEEVRIPPTPTAAMRPNEKLIEIKELDDFAQAAFHGYKSLNRIQSHIYQTTYNTNENILVCAPTGAGKTNIAMISVLHEIKQHFRDGFLHKDEFKIVYVAPMKALAAEVTTTFSHRLSPLNLAVRELTGDMQLSKNELEQTQMIVTTPEKWDVITRKSSDMSLSMLVKLLIIDEVHLLNDDRGPVIEALVARTLRQVESTQSMIRIVGLSATLPNYLEVAQFLHVNPDSGLFFFDSSYRPVPLAQQYIGITEKDFYKKNALFNSICFEKVLDSIKQGHQAMVFVHSRKDTGKTARTLNELALNSGDLELFRNDTHPQFALIKKEVSKSRNRELVELFESGFGIHHAGMLRSDRALTERLFSDGLLKVLVCTATLAWGVNLPAHTVIIKGTQLYDPKAGGWRDLGMLDVMQIFGRAGRPQFDKSGEGIILTTHDKLAYYLRLLTSQLPIESQFINSMKDNLNAEVVLGTVTNIKEACAWLGYTYLFIRMKTNPLVYGIPWDEVIADPSLVSKQRSLIIDAARALDKAKMMRFDEKSGNFYCTELGRIASHFYLQYSSVETYNEMLRRHMSDSEVINMVAHSSEFENIVVREEEQDELENLLKMLCPLEVKGGPTDKHGKIAILIQVYISRGSIESFSLISDAAYISASLARIMRALFEICLRRGWCEMSALMLQYCKAVDLRIWPHQHPLRQFDRDLTAAVLKKLEERGTDLDHLFEMEEKDISALIRYAPGGKLVKQYLSYFPNINLSATVSPITRTVLKVDLLITPEFNWKDRFHGTSQRWWILVEDSENDHIYHSELFTLTKRMARPEPQKISFTVPIFEPHPPQYYIRAVSDSWLHAESLYTVSFHNLTLPETQISHTELLDLKPLPVGSLGNKTYKNLYKFSHFNPIQTQAFHILYHLDNNVLLGAPTGSGKTISAELAMLHLFDTQPDMKVVYIAPLKAIVRERMNDWKRRLVSPLGKKMVEMTGDFTPDLMALLSADIIISTPEKWDGISRSWKNRSYVMKVGLMILDEIHLLGADRGPILEVIVSRMRYISSQTARSIRFVGLSTALANACDLASWLGVEENGLFNFKPSVRPVPLEVHIQGYPGKFYCPRMNSMNKPAYAAICTHSPTKPVLIFVSSRRQTRLTALDLIQLAASDESPRKFLNMPEESLEMILSQITDYNLRHTLQFGIGLHHAGLNDRDRSLVEELFSNNKIQILVCTSTLAWGVNLPAHLVIIKGTEYYDGKTKRYVDFPITDILQMMGRAGRPQYDQHGKAVILVHEPKKSFYKKFLYEPFPVESNLREHLHDHINAEVVSGTISHKEDAVHYLTWTFLFRRLVLNPSYYGLEDTEENTLNSFLSSLVLNTFEVLEDSGCIKINENSVEPLMLGSIASQYYLSYRTVSMFGANIGPDTSLETFLGILSAASEFDELPVRHNEENHNKALSEKLPCIVDERRLDDPHIKANLLFQAHFSRIELPITDYVTDLKSVLDQSIRIIQAMIDISANSGWLSSTMTCMHLLQMIMQGLWYGNESSLWMLPCMNKDLLSHLNNIGISSLQDLLELPKEKFNQKLQKFAADLDKDLQHFPRIRVRVKLQYRDGKASEPEALNIRLEKINSKHSRAFVPRYPKVKNEAWWLVLGNATSSELYALKRVSFSGQTVTRMELPPSKINFQETKLFLVSDCYIGYEQECPIEIH